jgi:hypothetical protein
MAASFSFYGKFFASLANKEIDFNSDSIKLALVTSGYTFDHDGHDYFNDITNEVVGTGYTAGGAAVGSPNFSYVPANSWSVARANSTAYTAGQVVRTAAGNGFLYQALTSGTSGGSAPTWPTTIGGTVTDGTVTWACVARGALLLTGNNVSWPASTLTARGAILYDASPATDATRPLIGYLDYGTDVSSTSGTFASGWDPAGIGAILVP